jgi:hypothetical protein
MKLKLMVRRYKNSKILSRPVFIHYSYLIESIQTHLDLSFKDTRKLLMKNYVKANTKFGVLHLTLRVL